MGVREEKVDFWKAKGKNAVFTGPTGVGKTAMVLAMMKRSDLSFDTNVAQWSPALVDFVGVKPENADLLFFDDFNDEKTRLAVQEVMGLRRWKGKAIKPTAIVWVCHTKMWDEQKKEYSDPDSFWLEKFEVCVTVPNSINLSYFEEKFGKRVANVAWEWWNDLPGRYSDTPALVTPRRLEQALDMWKDKGDIRDTLPMSAHVSKLVMALNVGPVTEKLEKLLTEDENARRTFFANENNFATAFKHVCQSDTLMRAFVHCWSQDRLITAMMDKMYGDKLAAFVGVIGGQDTPDANPQTKFFADVIRKVLADNNNKYLVKKFRRLLTEMTEAKWSGKPTPSTQEAARTVSETTDQ